MNKIVLVSGFVAVSALLGGCMKSESAQLNSYYSEGDQLLSNLQQRNITPTYALPPSGTARYEGVVAIHNSPNRTTATSLRGRSELNVSFGYTSRIHGTLSDFVTENSEEVDGVLRIDPTSFLTNRIVVSASGNLIVNGVSTNYRLNGDGYFYGTRADMMALLLNGVAVGQSTGARNVTGAIVAEN